MKVEIWTDYVCPYCYVGKTMFYQALKKFEHSEDVEVIHRSFILRANAPVGKGKPVSTPESIIERAKLAGLDYNKKYLSPINTMDAHRLSQYAKEVDKIDKLSEKIFKAQFIDCLDISNHDVLLKLAEEAGISREAAKKVLESDAYIDEVMAEHNKAEKEIDVDYVPYFLFNGERSVSGDYTADTFLDTMNALWNNEEAAVDQEETDVKKAPPGVVCEGGVCRIVFDDEE